MDAFLKSRKPTVITTSVNDIAIESVGDPAGNSEYDTFLLTRKPTVIVNVDPKIRDIKAKMLDDSDIFYDPNLTIVAPMNTDIRFGGTFPAMKCRDGMCKIVTEKYTQPSAMQRELDLVEEGDIDDSDIIPDVASDDLVIPPLNTDIRIEGALPQFTEAEIGLYAAQPLSVARITEKDNFSWHIITDDDDDSIVFKKQLMHPVQNQHMCGSCWAMALAGCISDCFVVSGAVSWAPKISPTYLMMTIPENAGNGKCNGGNPALTTKALESMQVADTTCIDYSWCAADSELCTSAAAANHFSSTLGQKLNRNVPTPGRACYFGGERFLYQIDQHSDALFIIDDDYEQFREIIKTHIVEYGPPLAGYAVMKNFVTGNFTDPNVNQGVYFDRASYPSSIQPGTKLTFNDRNASESNLSGLHAVQVVGWGLAKNIQYDNDRYGDVPFWWAKNSWGSNWGNMGGYFKIAMYPFNKFAQFGKQILVKGSRIGGLILLRCTKPPTKNVLNRINEYSLKSIKRTLPDDFYRLTPEAIIETAEQHQQEHHDPQRRRRRSIDEGGEGQQGQQGGGGEGQQGQQGGGGGQQGGGQQQTTTTSYAMYIGLAIAILVFFMFIAMSRRER